MSSRFEILPGLPPYGPPAISFTHLGPREHREGLVVRFFPAHGDSWVGNFVGAAGGPTCNRAIEHPNKRDVIIVAKGDGCIVDPNTRKIRKQLAGSVWEVFSVPALDLVVLQGLVDFEAINADDTGWRSNRISWDGFRNIEIRGTDVLGEALSPPDAWTPFRLDLLTGHCANGIYEKEMSKAIRIIPIQESGSQ
jgi:hypothetical protein